MFQRNLRDYDVIIQNTIFRVFKRKATFDSNNSQRSIINLQKLYLKKCHDDYFFVEFFLLISLKVLNIGTPLGAFAEDSHAAILNINSHNNSSVIGAATNDFFLSKLFTPFSL